MDEVNFNSWARTSSISAAGSDIDRSDKQTAGNGGLKYEEI